MRSGGQILIDQLVAQDVRVVFTVPGESFLPALDALRDCRPIQTVVCRHEGGTTMMAEASARLAGRPAVALVTRAPGAANAVAGVICAAASAAPLLLVVGLPRTGFAERAGAFQDIDLAAVFGPLAKWAAVCRDAARIPEYVERACRMALSGRPGPVVLGVPEDVLAARVEAADAPRYDPPALVPDAAALGRLAELLGEAQRPLMIVGGPGWSAAARADLTAFAAAFDLPVATAFRRQDAFDNRHPSYIGHCSIAVPRQLAAALRAADLLILAGAEPDEITSGGWTRFAPGPEQHLVSVTREAIGAMAGAHLTLSATPTSLAAALAALEPPWRSSAAPEAPWAVWRRDLAAAARADRTPEPADPLAQMFGALSDALPADAIVCGGAGNYAATLHRHFVFKEPSTSLSPLSGSMGYGLPAAIAASLAEPHRTVVAVAGDGCLLMTVQELATASQYGCRVLVVVVNNGRYGTIRMHQERAFPGRAFATSLANPDFCALARSFGAHAARVHDVQGFEDALREALPADGLRLVEIVVDGR